MAVFLPSRYSQLPDIAYDETEEILDDMIAEIESVYGQAHEELLEKAEKYLAWFEAMDAIKRKLFENGEITKKEYQDWRKNKLLTGQHWYAMAETMASDLVNADAIALNIVRDHMPEVYSINGNWITYVIEHETKINTSFELYDHDTIERLIAEHPDLLPQPKVNIPLDERWNKQNIQSAVMQSILQGESVDQLAERLADCTDMNQSAAVRNAKTATTSAQNGGRQDGMERAAAMGIKMKKVWIATLDFHTRKSHRLLDGVSVEIGDKFPNGCEFPGDPSGRPEEIWNCRCTMASLFADQDFSAFDRHSRLGVWDYTYDEWKESHGGEPAFTAARNANRDMRMWKEYKNLLGKQVPNKFVDFQKLKYTERDTWNKMKSDARKARNARRMRNAG